MTLTEIDPPGLVTAAEAALLRGVTARAVRFWTSEGLQVPVNLGDKGPRLYRIQDVTKGGADLQTTTSHPEPIPDRRLTLKRRARGQR